MELTEQSIGDLIAKIESEILSKSYSPPTQLLKKIDPKTELGKAIMSYVSEGVSGWYYQFLPLLVRYLQPKNIVELGSQFGVSTNMIYSELPSASKFTTVDIIKDQRFTADEVYKDKRVRFVYGDDLNLNIYGADIPQGIDLFYTDTIHFYQQLKDEWDIYQYLLADKALVVVDDIYTKEKGKVLSELPFKVWDISKFCHHNGFALMLFEKPKNFPGSKEESLAKAALASSSIGFRKFNSLEREMENQPTRRYYAKARHWAELHPKPASILRNALGPIKKIITPKDKHF